VHTSQKKFKEDMNAKFDLILEADEINEADEIGKGAVSESVKRGEEPTKS
jgi:hypothetical protein